MNNKYIFYRNLGLERWLVTFEKMNNFTKSRNHHTFDEIWFVEHYSIFTQGQFKKQENLICINKIPVVNTNRGGQITYHGPGQQIIYFLIDLNRRKISIRELIDLMHKTVIETLSHFKIRSYMKNKSPGIYVNKKKICSLGLRIKKGSTLHGLSINVNMDLTPFNYIFPCGDESIKMTQIKDFYLNIELKDIRVILIKKLSALLKVTLVNRNFYN